MGIGHLILLSPSQVLHPSILHRICKNNKLSSLLFVCVIFVVEKAFAKPFLMAEKLGPLLLQGIVDIN